MHLSQLFEHPVKSARGLSVAEAEVKSEGLARDRRFLVHTADGTFISGRSHPRLVLVTPQWDGVTLTLSAPGKRDLVLIPSASVETPVAVWKDRFPAWDQGIVAATWLSEFLGDEVRLAWLGQSRRPLRWDRERVLTFADAAPFLALGTASLADLSARVGEDLSIRRFRPNLVIEGAEPYEEDSWRRIRIGAVEFLHLDGCGRCEFTTIDPETGERHPGNQPVATLEGYRRVDTGIYFGMNLMPVSEGTIRVGDSITVLERRVPLRFAGFWSPGPRTPWPEGETTLVCIGVRDRAPGVKTLTFRRQDGRPAGWVPGQYLTLRFDRSSGPVRRSYTISSSEHLEITVKACPGGEVSNWIHSHGRPGFEVVAEGTGGHFTLAEHPWASYLFLGAGSGMTPLMALLEQIAEEDAPVAVAVHQCAHGPDDVLFAEELSRLQVLLGSRLTVATRITSQEGHLDHQGLVKFCPDYRDRRALVCGPEGYRATVRDVLSGAGFKVDRRYHEERFGEAALEVPDDAVPGTVVFSGSNRSIASDGKSTILQLAERLGVAVPSSCRSGDCGTCRVQTGDGSWVLACHTFPRGDLIVHR